MMIQEELLTVPELRKRLACSSEKAYELANHPDCPVIELGGVKGKRVIWLQFIEWQKKVSAKS